MENYQIESLQEQLRRNRIQSYVFLGLLLLGVASIVYMVTQLREANQELAKQKAQVESQKNRLLTLEDSLRTVVAALSDFEKGADSLKEKQALRVEISHKAADYSLTYKVATLNRMTYAELKSVYDELKDQAQVKIRQRNEFVRQLFDADENMRASAIDGLIRNYLSDPNLPTELVTYAEDKVSFEQRNGYWNVLYMLTRIDGKLLQPHVKEIESLISKGDKAQINGTKTQADIRQIRQKLA